jgi:hypothetical protein
MDAAPRILVCDILVSAPAYVLYLDRFLMYCSFSSNLVSLCVISASNLSRALLSIPTVIFGCHWDVVCATRTVGCAGSCYRVLDELLGVQVSVDVCVYYQGRDGWGETYLIVSFYYSCQYPSYHSDYGTL